MKASGDTIREGIEKLIVKLGGRIVRGSVFAALAWLSARSFGLAIAEPQPSPSQPSAQFTLPPLTEAELDVFRDSLRVGHPFAPVVTEVQEDVDDAGLAMWAGSRTTVESDVDSVVLRFAPKVDGLTELSKTIANPAATPLPSFDVQISLKNNRFELQHSAGDRRSGGGFGMLIDQQNAVRSAFVGGEQGSSLYAAIPLIADGDLGWGVLLCPRVVSQVRRGRSNVPILAPSVYGLSEVKAIVSVRGDARVSTAGAEGRSRISAAVTQGFPAPRPDYDQASSALPQVDLYYNPGNKTPFFSLLGLAGRQEGVRMLVEMQNAAGYVRRQYFLQAILIQRIHEAALAQVSVEGRNVESDEGECYVVIVRRHRWSTYGREKPLF